MTDNFAIIRNYMKGLGIPEDKLHINDKVFEIQLLRRGKDCSDLPAANYSFKNYYIDSLEGYDRVTDEIKKCCEMFRLRAYVSVNVKSKTKLQLQCLKIISDNLCMGELKKPWKTFYKAFGSTVAEENRWIVDVDEEWVDYKKFICGIINKCQSKYSPVVIGEIPTRTGLHLITHPFNMKQYKDEMIETFSGWSNAKEVPEVKKNHITLLFENL